MEKGFLFFDDWERPFRKLSGDEFKELFWAMFDYQKDGTQPPNFDGNAALIADFVFPQLERRSQRQKAGRESVLKRWNNEGAQKNDSNLIATYKQPNSNLIHKDIDKDIDKDIPPKPPVGADVTAERFDAFWKAYPKKVGKGAAEKSFKKIKPSGDLLQKMLDAIEVQKQSDQWKRDNGQYIPNPATWLNQTRWEDSVGVEKMPDYSMEELIALGLI